MSFDLGGILSSVVNMAVTYFTGSPMLGQLAGNFVNSVIGDSQSSGNDAFSQVFSQGYQSGFSSVFG